MYVQSFCVLHATIIEGTYTKKNEVITAKPYTKHLCNFKCMHAIKSFWPRGGLYSGCAVIERVLLRGVSECLRDGERGEIGTSEYVVGRLGLSSNLCTWFRHFIRFEGFARQFSHNIV
jgi:hypothetical protein